MATIQITKISDTLFAVTVAAGSSAVQQLSVQADYAQKLTGEDIHIVVFIKKSFEFLLAPEPNATFCAILI